MNDTSPIVMLCAAIRAACPVGADWWASVGIHDGRIAALKGDRSAVVLLGERRWIAREGGSGKAREGVIACGAYGDQVVADAVAAWLEEGVWPV